MKQKNVKTQYLISLVLVVMGFLPHAHATEKTTATLHETPISGLNADFIYKYLVGEVAGQRGNPGLAGMVFLDLAKQNKDARLAERAAKAALYSNDGTTASEAVKLWAELAPDAVEAQQAVMQILVSQGKLQEAKPYLEKLLTKEETRANGFLYLNGLFSRSADKETVFQLLQDLAKPYPSVPEAHFAVAHAAWSAGHDNVALSEVKLAETNKAGWEPAALLHGNILAGQSPQKAIAYYQQYLTQNPSANEVRLSYAKQLVSLKQVTEAKAEFVKLADYAKNSPEILVIIGLLAAETNDFTDAEKYFKQALNNQIKDADQVHMYLGQLAEKQKNEQEALSHYGKVQPGVHYLEAKVSIANVTSRTKGADAAIKQLDVLRELNGQQQSLVNHYKANILVKAKREPEAYALLEKTVNTLPNTPELIYDFAMSAERMKKLDVMEKQLRKLILLKPDYAAAYNALGYSFADRNTKLQEAKTLIEKALELSPNDHYILDSMGWVHYRLGSLDEAEEILKRAYATQTDPEIAAHLGEVLWKLGKKDEALKTLEDALQQSPDNETLLNTSKKFK